MILFIHNDFHQVASCIICKIDIIIYIYRDNLYEIRAQPCFLIWKYHSARMYSYCLPDNHCDIGFDLRGKRDTFLLYFISLVGLLISMAYYYSNGTRNLLLVFQVIFKLIALIKFFDYL
jgi:hypothetical protein